MTVIIPEPDAPPAPEVHVIVPDDPAPVSEHCEHCVEHEGRIAGLEAEIAHLQEEVAEVEVVADNADTTADVALDVALDPPIVDVTPVEPEPEPMPEPIAPKRTFAQRLLFGS